MLGKTLKSLFATRNMINIRKSQKRSQNREGKIMTKIEKGRLTIF